jgi:hypothetical protein
MQQQCLKPCTRQAQHPSKIVQNRISAARMSYWMLVSTSLSKIPAFFRADMTAASVTESAGAIGAFLASLGDLADLAADLGRDVPTGGRGVGVSVPRRLGDCRRPAADLSEEGNACSVQWSEGWADGGRACPSWPACCKKAKRLEYCFLGE